MSGQTERESTRTELAGSFDAIAAAYELGRPEYPDAVLDWMSAERSNPATRSSTSPRAPAS
jgi:hypothetical protein